MKKIILILLLVILHLSFNIDNCIGQWIQVNSGTSIRIEQIFMTNTNTIYFTTMGEGYSAINRKTTNGGLTWFQFADWTIGGNSVYFINVNTGFISGIDICNTTNAGNNWSLVYTPPDTVVILGFHFPNSTIGYGIGIKIQIPVFQLLQTVLVKTTNSGFNWMRLAPPISGSNIRLVDVFFTDANTGYTVGWSSNSNILLKTTDGGYNWSSILSGIGSEAYAIHFTNANIGYVCGQNGIYKTTNAGINWFPSYNSKTNDIYFINANTGFAICSNGIIRTNNAGANWTVQDTTFNELFSIMFYGNYTGFAAGENGVVVKTTNGGSVSVSVISTEIPSEYSLEQNYPNPFNAVTSIKFKVASSEDRSQKTEVRLKVFDLMGREVRTLVDEELKPGIYSVRFDAKDLPSGIYFYRMETEKFTSTKKLILIK